MTRPPDSPLPHDAQWPHPDEELRQKMWEYVYELLPPEEADPWTQRITSDPEIARLYAEVKLQAARVAEALVHQGPRVPIVVPAEESPEVLAGDSEPAATPVAVQPTERTRTVFQRWVTVAIVAATLLLAVGWALSELGWQWLLEKPGEQLPPLTRVMVPSAVAPDQPLTLILQTLDASQNHAVRANITVFVSANSTHDKPLWLGSVATDEHGLATVVIPKEHVKEAGQIKVYPEGRPEAAVRARVGHKQQNLAMHVATDRFLYRPGDTVHFRYVVLDPLTLTPGGVRETECRVFHERTGQLYNVDRLERDEQNGLAHGSWKIPERRKDEDPFTVFDSYTLLIESSNTALSASKRFYVNLLGVAPFDIDAESHRDAHNPGDLLHLDINLRERGAASEDMPNSVQLRVTAGDRLLDEFDLAVRPGQPRAFQWKLPDPWPNAPLLLHILARHGTSSTYKLLPVRRRGAIPTVSFYPEDGQLIAGLPSRVYFEARDDLGFPARLHAELCDSQNRVIDNVETYSGFDGWGVCSFTPHMGENYVLRDATTGAQWPLPPVRDGTLVKAVMRVEPTVVTNDQPKRQVQVKAFANHARTLLAVVSKENVVVEQQPLKEMSDGQNALGHYPWRHEYTADVNLPAQLSGLIRVTLVDVSDETPSPLVERLVFCEPARLAKLVPQQAVEVVAGQPWSFDLQVQLPNAERPRQEAPHGVVAVNIQPQSVSSSWNTSLLADIFLRDGSGFLDDNDLLLPDILSESDLSRRRTMIELLLGTRGWRIRNIPTDDGLMAKSDSADVEAALHGAPQPGDQRLSSLVREQQDFLGRSAAERLSLTVADNKATLDQWTSIEPQWSQLFTGIVEKFYANRAVACYVSWLALMLFVILALGLRWTSIKVGVSSLAVALLFLVLGGWQFGLVLRPAADTTVAKLTPQSWPGGEVARQAKPIPGGDVAPPSGPAEQFSDTYAEGVASRESAPGVPGEARPLGVENSVHESLSSRDKQPPQPRESSTNQEKLSQPQEDALSEPSAGIAARQHAAAGAGRDSTEPGRAPAAAVAEGRRSALRGSTPRGIELPAPQLPAPRPLAPQPPEAVGQATPSLARKASAATAVERDTDSPSSTVQQAAPDSRALDEQQAARRRQLQVQSRHNLQQYRLMEQIAELPFSVAIQGNFQANQALFGVPAQVMLQNDRSAAAPQTHAVVPDALRMAPLKRQSDKQLSEQNPEVPLFEESLAAEGLWQPVIIVKGGQVQTAWQVPKVAVPYWAVAVFHGQNAVGESRWTLQPLPNIEVTSKPFDQGLVLTVGDSLGVPLEWINRSRELLRVQAPLGTAPFMQLRLSPALLKVQPQEKQGALLHLQTQFPPQTGLPVFVPLVDESSFTWEFDKFLEDGCWQVNLEWQQEPASVTRHTVWLAPQGYPHTTPPVLIRGEGGAVTLQEPARHALWHRVTVRIYPTTAAEVWDTVGWLTKHPPPPTLGRLLAERLLRWSEERKIAAPQLKRQVKHWLASAVTEDYTAYAPDVSQWLQVEAAALKLAEGSGTAASRPRAGSRAEGAVNPPMTTRLKQLALAARIAVLQGAPEAGQLLQQLAEAQSPDGALRERTFQNQSDGRQASSSDVETTALAVLAWSHAPHATEYSAHVTRALEWLRQQRAADGSFGSVWASSLAVMALLSEPHDAAYAADTAPRQATLWIDGAELHHIVFAENSILPVVQHVLLPGTKANQIRLRLGDPESETSTARALLAVRSWVEEVPTSASTYQLSVRLEPQEGKVQDRGRLLIELAGSEPKSALLSIGLPAGLEPDLRALPPQVSLVGRRLWLRIEWPFRGPQEWVVSEGCLRFEIPVQLRWAGHFTGPPSFVACDDEPQNSAWAPPLVVDIRP